MTDLDIKATQSNAQTDISARDANTENSASKVSTSTQSDSASPPSEWYIVKTEQGQCEISDQMRPDEASDLKSWGPFSTQSEAIARRVGLIRSGKCKPH